ncbi:MAG: hypothetical protein U5K33_08015 [Halofilum sp. (in: g-proteobacteria)]|nr:hypothetical protein [Halofilum sp. (in: g-proteobacteria)]
MAGFPLHPRRLADALDVIDRDWLDARFHDWRRPAAVLAGGRVIAAGHPLPEVPFQPA